MATVRVEQDPPDAHRETGIEEELRQIVHEMRAPDTSDARELGLFRQLEVDVLP